jgi:hypothetical protein
MCGAPLASRIVDWFGCQLIHQLIGKLDNEPASDLGRAFDADLAVMFVHDFLADG